MTSSARNPALTAGPSAKPPIITTARWLTLQNPAPIHAEFGVTSRFGGKRATAGSAGGIGLAGDEVGGGAGEGSTTLGSATLDSRAFEVAFGTGNSANSSASVVTSPLKNGRCVTE